MSVERKRVKVMFGSREQSGEGITKLSGLSELRDYFRKGDRRQEDILSVELFDLSDIVVVGNRIPHIYEKQHMQMHFVIEGNPLMLALITGEHGAAEQILNSIQTISIKSMGTFTIHSPLLPSSEEQIEFSLESLLYEAECNIPIPLRKKMLSGLSEEAPDLYEWDLGKARGLGDTRAQKLFLADRKRFPNLFERTDRLYANDMSSLLFLLQTFPEAEEADVRRLLLSDKVMYQICRNIQNSDSDSCKRDMTMVGQVVMLLQKRQETHQGLYIFLLALISRIRRKKAMISYLQEVVKQCSNCEEEIWRHLKRLPFSENTFQQLAGSVTSATSFFRIELLYELAVMKLGKKMPLYISCGWYGGLDSFFQLYSDEEDRDYQLPFSQYNDRTAIGCRLFRLLQFVSTIEYEQRSEEAETKNMEVGLMIEKLITEEADRLKDFFIELLEKGFVPQYCLDDVISEAIRNENCSYMMPFLILQKYNGLRKAEDRS